jgi:DNA (cytosine-5)-methyltransferase 1
MIVVAENVSHILRLNDGKDLRKVLAEFRSAGYSMHTWKMYAPDFGIPQARDRVFFIGVRNDLHGAPSKPEAGHAKRHRSVEWAIRDLIRVKDESIPNQSEYFQAGIAKTGHGQGDEISKRTLPGYTVRANAKSRVQFHYRLKRRLTMRECARLQTFPDDFVFPHPPTNTIKQIGNAVPPILAYQVARQIEGFLRSLPSDKG